MTIYNPYDKQAIFNLQRYLRQLSYFDDDISAPPLDGIFDSSTKDSLVSFQLRYGLNANGVADELTWRLLFDEYKKSIEKSSKPLPFSIFPRQPLGFSLTHGDSSVYVVFLQYMLRELSRDLGEAFEIITTGIYDEDTISAVTLFQEQSGLDATGEVDLETWQRITRAYNLRSNEYQQ